ncbi:hypothetical protein ABZ873_34160, partial [Streptomyces sp. NPDC047014]
MSSSSSKSSVKPLLISAGVALAAVTLGVVSWQATAPEGRGDAARPDRKSGGVGKSVIMPGE